MVGPRLLFAFSLLPVGACLGCQGPEASPVAMLASGAPDRPASPGARHPAYMEAWQFVEVSRAAGIDHVQQYTPTATTRTTPFAAFRMGFANGVASGDFDGDGLPDLYAVGGDTSRNYLYRNRGDGTFAEVAEAAGVALAGSRSAGPLFADLDGDGILDLVVGGIEDTPVHLFLGRGDGTFRDATADSGLASEGLVVSASAGDVDLDGDLDLLLGRWGCRTACEHLFRNDGDARFVGVGRSQGADGFGHQFNNQFDFTFSPFFLDLDGDRYPELLMPSDYHTTQYFRNQGGAAFTPSRDDVASGYDMMGTAVLDIDGDGRLDWFMTGTYDPTVDDQTRNGNRLFRSTESGFVDITDKAGVRNGSWGWAVCAADFDEDGLTDLFHVNGYPVSPWMSEYPASPFFHDKARLFLAVGDGTFRERAAAVGIADPGMGRGVVCFDYDGDGDIDVFIANAGTAPALYRNDLGRANHFLEVRLAGAPGNREGIGARVELVVGGRRQIRAVRAGTNFASQDPPLVHFGLGDRGRAEELRVRWPDGAESLLADVAGDQLLVVNHP